MKPEKLESWVPHAFSASCALVTLCIVISIIWFVFSKAYPVLKSQGIYFLIGSEWNYNAHIFGIKIFLISTLILTLVTTIMAVPIGILTAVFLAEFAPEKVASVIKPLIELLVGIPSVVYGIFGFRILRILYANHLQPFISNLIGFIPIFHDPGLFVGQGVFLASTVLAIMILPTIVAVSENAIRSVPYEYKEASLSIGATHWETIKKVILPTAKSGIMTAVILGIMRAVGETMAVVMLIGCSFRLPNSLFDVCFPMTSKLLGDFGENMALPERMSALFALAFALFVIEIILVGIARKIGGKSNEF